MSSISFISVGLGSFFLGYYISKFFLPPVKKEEIISENEENEEDEEDSEEEEDEETLDFPERYKMVLITPNDLKLGKGKLGAQCGHAALGAYKRALKRDKTKVKRWEISGQAKIVLRVENEVELLQIEKEAKEAGLTTFMVMDAGRTQIAFGTKTVLAIGPDVIERIDAITKRLKLMT